jgi:hypothetical protein
LIRNTIPRGKESDDAETRKMAVRSLIKVVKTYGMNDLPIDLLNEILESLYNCMNDYQIDRRGDVGSWVREEAMLALKTFVRLAIESDQNDIINGLKANEPHFYERFIKTLL